MRYIKASNGGARLYKFKAKFIERQTEIKPDDETPCDLVFIGVTDELTLTISDTPLEAIQQHYLGLKPSHYLTKDVKTVQDYVFGSEVIIKEQSSKKCHRE